MLGRSAGFQARVHEWMMKCFGHVISGDEVERNHRFLEEALELVQACNCTKSEAMQLVDYVFDREIGEKPQEVGGVMVTLSALCTAQSLDMMNCGSVEVERIWENMEKIKVKQENKPKHSPLPQAAQNTANIRRAETIKDIAARAHCGHWDGDAEALIGAGYDAALSNRTAQVPYDHTKSFAENLKAIGVTVLEIGADDPEGLSQITNKMKADCIGEFEIEINQTCSACFYHEAQEDCEVCGGEVEFTTRHTIPWTTMKDIYKMMTRSKYA